MRRYTPTTSFETFPFPEVGRGVPAEPSANTGSAGGVALPPSDESISAAAKELNELRERWLNPPEWTKTEVLEFPGTVGGPWDRYILNPEPCPRVPSPPSATLAWFRATPTARRN